MILAAVGFPLAGLLIGLLVGVLLGAIIYYAGVHFGAPPPLVGIVALVVLIICILIGLGRF